MSDFEKNVKKITKTIVDVKRMMDMINDKLQNKKSFSGDTYRDEPIIRPASHMVGYVPEPIRKMRLAAKQFSPYSGRNQKVDPNSLRSLLFYRQAKMMENYEDDYEYHGEFLQLEPTYQKMNDMQLRGYFAWRTKVRQGEVKPTSRAFATVYAYELLNRIGASEPMEAFRNLQEFWAVYRNQDPKIDTMMRAWLNDFVVYYNLDSELLCDDTVTDFDWARQTLVHYEELLRGDVARASWEEQTEEWEQMNRDSVYHSLLLASSYPFRNSEVAKAHPEETKELLTTVFEKLVDYYAKNRKTKFCDKLFGKSSFVKYTMFKDAVFYDERQYQEYEYQADALHCYRCNNGVWTKKVYAQGQTKSSELGQILLYAEQLLCEQFEDCKATETEAEVTAATKKLVKDTYSSILKEKERLAKEEELRKSREVHIDLSKLSAIRAASEITRDKLIVEEEITQEAEVSSVGRAECENEITSQNDELLSELNDNADGDNQNSNSSDSPLNDTERELFRRLLVGEEYKAFLRERGMMLSVAVDAINDKLFDEFGDTVIIFEGDAPVVLEDYEEDLKRFL